MKKKSFFFEILSAWYTDGSLKEGAALSFYTLLALPALVVGLSSLALLFFDRSFVQEKILFYSSLSFGSNGQEIIASMANQIPHSGTLTLTTFLSMVILFILASSIFSSLQDSLNVIFHTPITETKIKKFLQNRTQLFFLVLCLGGILIVNTFLQGFFSFGATHVEQHVTLPFGLLHIITWLTNIILFFTLTAFLLRYLPEKKPHWKNVWFGSFVTTVLFTLGKYILGAYIDFANFGSAYGAAGSLMALLVWIYYSSQTFFLGAECVARREKA
jgi:membrane protein